MSDHRRIYPIIALLLLAVVFAGWQSRHLGAFALDYDEGVYLAEARLVHTGKVLYVDVETPLPPLLLWGLAGVFTLTGGATVAAARMATVLSGVVGLIALAAIGAQLHPRRYDAGAWADIAAAVLMAVFPLWYLYGRLAMADIPSLSASLVAIALALCIWYDARRLWLVFAGAVAAVALFIKLSAVYAPAVVALVVLLRERDTESQAAWLREFVRDGGAAVAGFLVITGLVLLVIDVPAAMETAVRYHLEAARGWSGPPYALSTLKRFVVTHAGWVLLAGIGFFWYLRNRMWRPALLIAGWGGIVALMLARHAPLWDHLLLPLVPPLALAGGVAAAEAGRTVQALGRERDVLRIATVLAVIIAAGIWPIARSHDEGVFGPPSHILHLETIIVPWLSEITEPTDTIISDSPMIAFRAGRNVPANLTDTSYTRIKTGFLTADDLIATAQREQPAAIIFWRDRFTLLPAWLGWVRNTYVLRCELGPERLIFVRPDIAERTDGC